jgi:hypothetical protein
MELAGARAMCEGRPVVEHESEVDMAARSVVIRLAGAVLIAGVLAVPAAAEPVPLTGQRTIDPMPVALAFDGAGRAVASWRTFVGKPGEGVLRHRFAVMDAAGRWHTPVSLHGSVLHHDLAVTRDGTVFAIQRLDRVGRRHVRSVIKLLVFDTASSSLRRVRTLAVGSPRRIDPEGTPSTVGQPRVAATPDGDVVVAWVRSESRRTAGVWVTTVHPNGRFDAARRIGPLGGAPVLSIARDGRGVVAWQRGHRIQARIRRPSGRWGPVELAGTTIGAVTWGVESVDVAAGDRGQVAVGVLQTARSVAGVRFYTTVHARYAGGVWRSAVAGDFMFNPGFDTSFVVVMPRVRTFASGDGRLHAAWPAPVDGHAGAAAATLEATAGGVELTSPVTLSPATTDAVFADAAGGPGGSYAAVWWDGNGPGVTEVDATGAVRVTTDLAVQPPLLFAKVALDPGSGRALVVFSEGTPSAGYRPVAWMR